MRPCRRLKSFVQRRSRPSNKPEFVVDDEARRQAKGGVRIGRQGAVARAKLGASQRLRRLLHLHRLEQERIELDHVAGELENNSRLLSTLSGRVKLRVRSVPRRRAAQMRQHKTGGERRLRVLPPHGDDGAARSRRIVIDRPQYVFLPVLQPKRLANELAARDEADRLDKLDHVGRCDRADRLRAPLTAGHRTSWLRSPMGGRQDRARTWPGLRERPCGSWVSPATPSGRR